MREAAQYLSYLPHFLFIPKNMRFFAAFSFFNEILAFTRMKSNPPSAAAISSDQREDFIIGDDFTHPKGWISLKKHQPINTFACSFQCDMELGYKISLTIAINSFIDVRANAVGRLPSQPS